MIVPKLFVRFVRQHFNQILSAPEADPLLRRDYV